MEKERKNIKKDVGFQASVAGYQKLITEMVEKIENPEFLEFLYQMLLSFKEKWGI